MTETPPPVHVESARTSFWDRASIVWLLPVAALLIALGIATQYYYERGPVIEITFEDSSGVKAGETELRFRDVAVGVVERVGFTEDLARVLVSVRIDKDVAPFVDADSQFWVVAPEVSTRGVTGLDTVLSGVFIEGLWDQTQGEYAARFTGLEDAPLLAPDGRRALTLELRSSRSEGFTDETPILYKGIEVGRIGSARIALNGSAAIANAVIYEPYDQLVTTETRFWESSGFSLSIGAEGAEIDFDSLASLLSGGITFDTLVAGGGAVRPGTVFEVYPYEVDARNSIFDAPVGPTQEIAVVFEQNVGGLAAGAPVEMDGVPIGTVSAVTGVVDEARFGDRNVRLQAILQLEPGKMGLAASADREALRTALAARAEEGMRARLASRGLLTGGVKVELVVIPGIGPAPVELVDGIDVFPTAPPSISDVAATAEGVFERLNALPVEEVLGSAIRLMNSATTLISDPELGATPAELRGLLAEVRGIVGSQGVQDLPEDVSALVADLQAVATELRVVVAEITAEDGVARLLAAVDAAGVAAAQVGTATESVPALVAEIEAVAAKVAALPVEDLLEEATVLVASANGLLGSEAAQAVPAQLNDALGELSSVLEAVTAEDGIARLLAAVDAAGVAAEQVGSATAGVPALVAEIEAVAAKAGALPLEELVSEASALVASANGVLGSEAARAVPEQLNAALGELSSVLESVTAEDGVARLLAAVDAAGVAAEQVGAATAGVPALVAEIEAVAAKAGALPLEELVSEASALVASANGVLGSEAARAVPEQLNAALGELSSVLESVTAEDGVARLLAAVDAAGTAAEQVGAATEGVPALVAEIEAVAAKAGALPLEDSVREASALVASANGVLGSEAARAVPAQLNAALGELWSVLESVTAEDGVARLLAAVDAAGVAAEQVGAATEGVPALVAEIEAVAARAGALPLEDLMREATALVDTANSVLGTEAARDLPEALNGALNELASVLETLQDGGLIENANGTLSAARRAADQIAISAEGFPAVIDRVDSLLRQAEETLAALDGNSDLNRGAVSALRDVQAAADAVASLARTLERRPNSIILGR